MIRTEISAEMDILRPTQTFTINSASEHANRVRCAQADVAEAAREYVKRRADIGKANRNPTDWMHAQNKRAAFIMFNRARAALIRAEKALKALTVND